MACTSSSLEAIPFSFILKPRYPVADCKKGTLFNVESICQKDDWYVLDNLLTFENTINIFEIEFIKKNP